MNPWKSTPAPYCWMYSYKLKAGQYATIEPNTDKTTWALRVYKSLESYQALEDPTDYWPFDRKREAVHFLKFDWDANDPTYYRSYEGYGCEY